MNPPALNRSFIYFLCLIKQSLWIYFCLYIPYVLKHINAHGHNIWISVKLKLILTISERRWSEEELNGNSVGVEGGAQSLRLIGLARLERGDIISVSRLVYLLTYQSFFSSFLLHIKSIFFNPSPIHSMPTC